MCGRVRVCGGANIIVCVCVCVCVCLGVCVRAILTFLNNFMRKTPPPSPRGNDSQARKATHGGHNFHSKPPNPP